jgi:hypothetical protein
VLTSSLYDGTVRLWENLTGMEDEQVLTCFTGTNARDKKNSKIKKMQGGRAGAHLLYWY